MKKNIIRSFILLATIASVMLTSCEDDFTEKDALDAQQTIDVSVYMYDAVTDSSVNNVAVTMINNGTEQTVQTNEMGIAFFGKVKIASNVIIRAVKSGYVKIQTSINISTNNYRQSQYTANVPMYSLTENTATIKGKLEIQTDLTNDEAEIAPEGTKVYAYLSSTGGNPVEFMATVDAEGKYELVVPADNVGVDYEMRYETLEMTQTIAKNGDKGDPEFPATVPSIVDINTLFNPIGNAINVPTVPSVYGLINDNNYSKQAIISSVNVNGSGEITSISINDNGEGYTADSVDVTIVSLFEGSGAQIRIGVSGGSIFEGDAVYHESGTGYPVFSNANQAGSQSNTFTVDINNLKSGEIRVNNGDYGTGVLRDQEIQ